MKEKHTVPDFDPPIFILLLVMLWVSSWTLVAADWTDQLSLTTTVGTLGLFAGTALARSRFSPRLARFFATCYGLFVIGWQLGRTLDPGLIWRDKFLALMGRIGVFFSVLAQGETNPDPLMFVLVMAALFWFFGCIAAWAIFRRGGLWAAILPPGIAVYINAYYYLGDALLTIYLAVYTFLALILFVRLDVVKRQSLWRIIRARVPSETSYRVSRAGLVAAFLIVGLSWVGPGFARNSTTAQFWRAIASPFTSTRDWFGDVFGSLRGGLAVGPEFYGNKLPLEGGVMPVEMHMLNVDPEGFPSNDGRFYWRSRIYDTYQDGGWSYSGGAPTSFDPSDGNLTLPNDDGRETIEVTITPMVTSLASLYLPPQPLWVNRTAEIFLTRVDGSPVDAAGVVASNTVMRGESYRARSSVAIPTAPQLREAEEDYPDWVLKTYLQIPNSISQRVIDLADTIVQGQDTAYDKTVAITNWLRRNMEYSRETEAPPAVVEPLDWFLFDYKIGFCNYYASAEVIMLRSQGIPARLAAGYAQGTFNPDEGIFEVTTVESHSWPEVYFPGYGWVEFEPTVSQSALDRPELPPESEGFDGGSIDRPDFRDDRNELDRLEDLLAMDEEMDDARLLAQRRSNILRWLAVLVVVLVLAGLWLRFNPSSWGLVQVMLSSGLKKIGLEPPPFLLVASQEDLTLTGRVYRRWTDWLRRIGITLSPAQTPYERAGTFATLLPEVAQEGWTIVTEYARERYGRLPVEEDVVRQAWRRLRPHLLLAWIWRATARFRGQNRLR